MCIIFALNVDIKKTQTCLNVPFSAAHVFNILHTYKYRLQESPIKHIFWYCLNIEV